MANGYGLFPANFNRCHSTQLIRVGQSWGYWVKSPFRERVFHQSGEVKAIHMKLGTICSSRFVLLPFDTVLVRSSTGPPNSVCLLFVLYEFIPVNSWVPRKQSKKWQTSPSDTHTNVIFSLWEKKKNWTNTLDTDSFEQRLRRSLFTLLLLRLDNMHE